MDNLNFSDNQIKGKNSKKNEMDFIFQPTGISIYLKSFAIRKQLLNLIYAYNKVQYHGLAICYIFQNPF